jgi:16S rRNA C967 or C1407 C5-methylase (RsmB/RsmF family)/NOL1/NOP2/fmu family ribosome biogenesis protein
VDFPLHFIEHLFDAPGFDIAAFSDAHQQATPVSIRYNPNKKISIDPSLLKVPWTNNGYYLPVRPSFIMDPLWHAGVYYVQEASSMFLEEVVRQTMDLSQALKVLDLCAAPGGKSTLLQSMISNESLLVSNEVIRTRVSVLMENMMKWGGMNVVVTHNDPADFQKVGGFFDLMVVDAPCSGSGLFRRDAEAMKEWSMGNVQLCAGRQQRILADAWEALKEEGVLIYSTCSFSELENEAMVEWIIQQFEVESLRIHIEPAWGITESVTRSGGYGYRCWPDKVKGEGFFLAAFRKKSPVHESVYKVRKYYFPSKKDQQIADAFVHSGNPYTWIMQGKYMSAVGPVHVDVVHYILERLQVRYAGVEAGMVLHDDFMPEQGLALSYNIRPRSELHNLTEAQAISYLKKEELDPAIFSKGLQWVGYQGFGLGWLKSLGNRINNYYPKEWRIRRKS